MKILKNLHSGNAGFSKKRTQWYQTTQGDQMDLRGPNKPKGVKWTQRSYLNEHTGTKWGQNGPLVKKLDPLFPQKVNILN